MSLWRDVVKTMFTRRWLKLAGLQATIYALLALVFMGLAILVHPWLGETSKYGLDPLHGMLIWLLVANIGPDASDLDAFFKMRSRKQPDA